MMYQAAWKTHPIKTSGCVYCFISELIIQRGDSGGVNEHYTHFSSGNFSKIDSGIVIEIQLATNLNLLKEIE